MRIVTYSELESKDGLLPLLDHAFNWVFNQAQFEKFARIDPRLKNSPISFCAIENNLIIGHVGVMDLATRTSAGKVEYVGGLFGVATLPGHTRRGVCTALMKRAHQYFKEKRYSFSLLTTSPALIAHALYGKLGYTDLVEYPSAYKAFQEKRNRRIRRKHFDGYDPAKILKIYREYTANRTGLVVRDEAYFRMLKKVEGLKPKQCIVDTEGYAMLREDKNGTWIRELVALNKEQMHTLINTVESRTSGPIYDRAILNQELLEVYKSHGYMIHKKGYSVMMFKPLISSASFEKTYGNKFYFSRMDSF